VVEEEEHENDDGNNLDHSMVEIGTWVAFHLGKEKMTL
jgi:hypothetical protein